MPAPTTADELLDLVQKSGLVEEKKLGAYVQKARDDSTFPNDANRLAQFLVRDALLTYFQAEQLLQGKYKRFSLGKYKVLEKLGSGGMGTVFLCEHKLMRRRVAVKVLPVPKAEDKASLDRFLREARAAAAVDHPNIVRAYDIDQDENLHFLVMEWVDGTNLQDLVKKFGPLDPLRACHYIYGAAVGLQHAYEIGLLHRDIKPGNILIDRSGVVKILDLGLARLTQDTEDNLTRQNDENVLGTADYLAPEQAIDSHTVDTRADIYSLGATFYFLLTGNPPFPEGSVAQKLIWHQNRQPKPLKSLRPETPDGVVAVVEKMMAKDQAQRYQAPAEVMAALSGWVSTPIPPPAEREMPTLSPAVVGDRGNRPAVLPSMVLGAPTRVPAVGSTLSGAPTLVATADPPLATAAEAETDEPAVWSTLGGDTPTDRGDTGRPAATEVAPAEGGRSSRVRRGQAARDAGPAGTRRKPLLLVGLAALFVAASAVGVYFAFFADDKKPGGGDGNGPVGPQPGARKTITVNKSGAADTVATLRQALDRATTGDTIVITDPELSEVKLALGRRHKGVTIRSETPNGQPAVIRYIGPANDVMLDVKDADGVRVQNLELDGKGTADVGVQVNGTVPGTVFEGVTVRGVHKVGFKLWNVSGSTAQPLALDHVRVVLPPTGESAVLSLNSVATLDNAHIAIRNGRFEGAGGGSVGVRLDGSATDFDVRDNRFHNLGAAVRFEYRGGRPSKGVIANNTVMQAGAGLQVEGPPKDQPAMTLEFKVERNYFAQTQALLRAAVPVPKLTSEDNLFAAGSAQGPVQLAAAKTDAALASADPNDAKFLQFHNGNTRPAAGPNKPPVGAP